MCVCGCVRERERDRDRDRDRDRGGRQEGCTGAAAWDKREKETRGLPWQAGGYDSPLPLQGSRVRYLVRKLRSHMLPAWQKKKGRK